MKEDLPPGTYTLRIESRGIGFEDPNTELQFHDEYHIWTLLRQPVYK